jgi:hypothetical protein
MLIRRRRTALSKTPHALADGLMLVFKQPVQRGWVADCINGAHRIYTGNDI